MSGRGVEEAGAVVSATLGSAQERRAAQLLAAGAVGAARREGGAGERRAVGRIGRRRMRERAAVGAADYR